MARVDRNVVREAAMIWMQSIGHWIYLDVMFVDNSLVDSMPVITR